MRKLFLSVLATLLFSLGGTAQVGVDSSYANGYYVKKMKDFRSHSNPNAEIVFIGNSITEAGDWEEGLKYRKVANRGISGDNSYGVYYRIEEALLYRPEKLFVMIGVNDLKRGTPMEYILGNYERIARESNVLSPQTQVYLQSVLPVRESVLADIYYNINNAEIRDLNWVLERIAEKHGAIYVDLYTEMFSEEEGELPAHLTTDGLHLSDEGYKKWITFLESKNYISIKNN